MQRLDLVLLERGLCESRTQAQRLIKKGAVSVCGEVIAKAGFKLSGSEDIQVAYDDEDRYVSRGGLKLEGALAHTELNPTALTCLDIGASTGGFSDCLIQSGAAKVVGIDVGHDQQAKKLQDDNRVVYLEGINARNLPCDLLLPHTTDSAGFELVVMDVSFISQTLIIPELVKVMRSGAHLISLVKPQFEVGKEGIGKGGIVREPSLYSAVEQKIRACCESNGLQVLDFFDSPIKGGDGNREFFICARRLD